MRISETMRFNSVQRSLADLRSRQAEVSDQVSSGSRVPKPSADPVAAAELTRLEAKLSRTGDYRQTISNVRSDLSLSERSLSEASSLFVKARELALQGANGGFSAEDRSMMAAEVAQLKDHFLSVANTRGTHGFLFAGSQTDTAAFSDTGVYQGDNAEHEVEIAPGVLTRVLATGAQAFTVQGGTDAYASLDALEQALLAGDEASVAATITNLDAAREQIVREQAEAGMTLNRLDAADEALAVTELELEKSRSERGDVDVFKAISELTQLSTSLEQAIGVARVTLNTNIERF